MFERFFTSMLPVAVRSDETYVSEIVIGAVCAVNSRRHLDYQLQQSNVRPWWPSTQWFQFMADGK